MTQTIDLDQACIASLEPHVVSWGLDCDSPSGNLLRVPSLHLDIVAREATARQTPSPIYHFVAATFDARPLGRPEPGICILTAGYGPSLQAAIDDAAHHWALGVLPVMVSFTYGERPVAEVTKLPIILEAGPEGHRYGWMVYLGPLIGRSIGDPKTADSDFSDLSPLDAFRALFAALPQIATNNTLMWIESVSARYPDGKIDATCRVRNHDWAKGKEALTEWAASWREPKSIILSKRQFILMQPVPPDRLQAPVHSG